MLNKVPEVTAFFWIIKVLCTTVGESAADYINENLGLGLSGTSLLMAAILIAVLIAQFRSNRYIPGLYWSVVVLVSVVGTLLTDNLTDNLGLSLLVTTPVFAALLAVTFAAWYRREGTLSIHSIVTTGREGWYWLVVLLTFALGTAAGDLAAERLSLGFGPSILLFAALIALVTAARFVGGLNVVLSFWLAYILTRPLGASIGDFLSADPSEGGRGLGTAGTSLIFLTVILALVVYLSFGKVDVIPIDKAIATDPTLAPLTARPGTTEATGAYRRT
jgi:uncharacterized membrane-anchored protein